MLLTFAHIACFLILLLHVYFALLEMVFWKQQAPRLFHLTPDLADKTAPLASNQGLYNIFIAVALLIGLFAPIAEVRICFILYALSCVIAAGIWGGMTVHKKIFFIQAVPGLIALALMGLFFLA